LWCCVPFADKEIFFAHNGRCRPQSKLDLTLYLIVVWRVYCLLHGEKVQMTDEAIFHDTSEIIKKAIEKAYALNNSKTNISATAFEIALKQLV
jgi:hypothetical protein